MRGSAGMAELPNERPLLGAGEIPVARLSPEAGSSVNGGSSDDATGTILSSTANVTNAALGAGVLAFPFAVKSSGLLFCPLLVALTALLMGATLRVLAVAAEASGAPSYQAALRSVLGGRLGARSAFVLESTVYLYVIGCGVAFLNVIADSIAQSGLTDPSDWIGHRTNLLSTYAAVVLLPLCLLRHMQSFRFTSAFAVCSIVFMVGVVVRYSVLGLVSGDAPAPRLFNWSTDIFKALPVVAFAFNCHLTFIPIYKELTPQIRSARTMSVVAVGTYTICFVTYMTCGIFGYLRFGEKTPGDILTLLPSAPAGANDDGHASCPAEAWGCPVDVNIARATIAITVSASYPMLQFVSRACLDDSLIAFGMVSAAPDGRIPTHRFVAETLFYVAVTTTVSIFVPNVADVMDVIGSTLATLQACTTPAVDPPPPSNPNTHLRAQVFIFPALLLWKLDARQTDDGSPFARADGAAGAPLLPKQPPRCLRLRICGERVPAASILYLFCALFVCAAYLSTIIVEGLSHRS